MRSSAALYRLARKYGQRYFLGGMNFSSESVHIPEGGYPSMDARNLRAIHRAHGAIALQTFPTRRLPRVFVAGKNSQTNTDTEAVELPAI